MTLNFPTLFVLLSLSINAAAQMRGFSVNPEAALSWSGTPMQGRVIARGVDVSRAFMVELVSCDQPGPGVQSSLSTDGAFSFGGLASGCYQIRVLTLVQREIVHHELLKLDRNSPDIVIDLHMEEAERPAAGFVSMQQLLKPPPKNARQAYEHAVRDASKGRSEDALKFYSRAIELFPDYASAHQGLATTFEQMDRSSEAAAEWRTARRLGIESPELYSGLALSLLELNRRDEAEQAARQALSMDPSYVQAHYLLASALMVRPGGRAEALAHFAKAAGRLPAAWLMSARLSALAGDFEGARQELGEYLKVCPESARPSAERWLAELQARNGPVQISRSTADRPSR